jgi:SPP1 family phage portal protein
MDNNEIIEPNTSGNENTGNENENITTPTTNTSTTATVPTKDYVVHYGPPVAQFYGRKILYDDYLPEDVNTDNGKENAKIIGDILNHVWSSHMQNANEIDYLEKYYRGFQPILGKRKDIRPTINNIILENNAYFVVNFKVGYVFGEPIQFIQRGDIANPEVGVLNGYAIAEDKYDKDSELAEGVYTSGIAHRLVLPHQDDNSPFDIINLDSKTSFLVYSSKDPAHSKLIGVTFTRSVRGSTIQGSVYTNTGFYTFEKPNTETAFNVKFEKNHFLGTIPIFEYHFNKWRLGIIEVVMSIFNAINRIDSGDLDGLEQYIQSLLVFINNEIDPETYKDVLDLGAVELSTADPARPADIKLLQNEISHQNTEVLHKRLLNTAFTILGIPAQTTRTSGGDTGAARQLSDGWTMAQERAKQEENAFKRCSKDEIKLVLKICRIAPNSGIENLQLKDIDQKLPRGRDDNFLVRAQGLMNLITSGVSPDVAYASTGLFPDSNEAYQKSLDFYGGIENWIKYFVFKQTDTPEGEEEETTKEKTTEIKGKEWSINRAAEKVEREIQKKND